jgi:hypothetical protein
MRKRPQGGQSMERLGVMNRKDILYPGSLLNIPEYKYVQTSGPIL